MPVLQVSALSHDPSISVETVLKRVCVVIAEVYGCPPQEVRGVWQTLDPGHYVEGEDEAMRLRAETHPPMARLICMAGKTPEEIERIIETTAIELGDALGVPGNVFVTYEEVPPGRMFDGDGVVRR